jgi:hypothetical protein
MHGQGLNAHRFMLTSSSQQDCCPMVARIRSRRPTSIKKATVPHDGLDAMTVLEVCHPLPAIHGHQGPRPRRPTRLPCAN